MALIVVGSTNPVKIEAALSGFRKLFPETEFEATGLSVGSGVGHQPMTDAETLLGAENRAKGCQKLRPEAHYWVGIEGGVAPSSDGSLEVFAWIVVRSRSQIGRSRTATFTLPPALTKLIQGGMELGAADDEFFKRSDSKRGNGSVGILTDNVIDRTEYYSHAVILALIPFKQAQLYS